jgi:PAS domain S-box-containing protein
MRESSSQRCQTNSAVSTAIERARAEGAESSDHAVIVGNRAGVVEWANDAWSQITGFPLAETLHKPISHFLEVAGIELELVDFVGQHYLEGRTCTIEFPFETFDEREIQVHLEVQPIRNKAGELDVFVATARVIPERGPQDLYAAHAAHAPATPGSQALEQRSANPRPRCTGEGHASVSLSECVRRACNSARSRASDRAHFDLSLPANLPNIELHADRLTELADSLIEAALQSVEESSGCVTVMTGLTTAKRGHVSEAYPIVARPAELAVGPHLFLEVHDTGLPLPPDTLARAREHRPGSSPREAALSRASEFSNALGAALHIDSTWGCGNQSLVLIPLR